jgi:hypothetical protein
VVFQVVHKSGPLTIGVCALQVVARWCVPDEESAALRPARGTPPVREKLGNEH